MSQKFKIENVSEGTMLAHADGYVLTQVELCKKLPPLKKQFASVRKELFTLFFNRALVKSNRKISLTQL